MLDGFELDGFVDEGLQEEGKLVGNMELGTLLDGTLVGKNVDPPSKAIKSALFCSWLVYPTE
jgi:hypothetical protein